MTIKKQNGYPFCFNFLYKVTISTASLTSWTRSIVAPCLKASQLRAIVPVSASWAVIPSGLYIIDFRDTPANTG